MDKFAALDRAAHVGANGHNRRPEATPGQRAAGNYLKGRALLHGLRIAIESPRGTLRHWQAADGASGSNLMKFHYGYIEGTRGNDGDELDVSLGPIPEAQRAYVVNQFIGGKFDEHKIMLGFPDQRTAAAGYLSNYVPGWQGLESCTSCSISQLKWWIVNGDKSLPLTQDQLPNEGTTPMEMEKVLWDSANLPAHSTLERVLYALRKHDGADGLLFDAVRMADIMEDADGVLALDALVIPFARLEQRMQLLQKVLDRAGDTVKVAAMQVSDPFTQRGSTNVAVVYELTDGQTVSVFFHNPDVTPKKIAAGDDVISWKWMLNKKDITVAVAPERGRDLDVRTVAARIMQLADKNSARFIAANGRRAEKMGAIATLKTELDTKKATLADLESQIAAARAVRQKAGLPDPVDPLPPAPKPEPAPGPAQVAPDVGAVKAVLASADPMPGVARADDWIVMNAPRPLMGTETLSNGEFLDGRFYAAIDPRDGMAQAYVDANVKLDASVVFVAATDVQAAMAMHTLSPRYLPAYQQMDEADRMVALAPFIAKLNGKSYGELKELAAKGVLEVPQPVHPEPSPRPEATDGNGVVPDDIARKVADALAVLREVKAGVDSAKALEAKFGSPGRYEWDALQNRKADIARAQKVLTTFRRSAPENGVDAEAHIAGLGGEPDLTPGPEALKWSAPQPEPVPAVDPEAEVRAAKEAEEAADGDFLALAAAGNVDFMDKAVTDRLAALAKKYTDGANLELVLQAKIAARAAFVTAFKRKVG